MEITWVMDDEMVHESFGVLIQNVVGYSAHQ